MSNVIQFVPATREQVFSRTCIHGPGGSGKTYTALMLCHELTNGGRFAVVDTERGRSEKYVGVNGWQFGILKPHSFNPESLIDILAAAADQGFQAIAIDSGSLYWNGADGMQEQVDRRTKAANRRDSFSSGWAEMAPIERRMWDAVMTFPGHVVMTLRVKSDYVVEEVQRNGRSVAAPRKVGLKPVQRDGFEYEFDLVLAMDQENTGTVVKTDMVVIPAGTVVEQPGPEFAKLIGDFCAQGVAVDGPLQYRDQALAPELTFAGTKELFDKVTAAGFGNTPVLDDLRQTVTLGDLIKSRAAALKVAEDARAREAAAAAQPAPATQPTARTSRRSPKVPANVAAAAGKGVDALLGAETVAKAEEFAGYARDSIAKDENVLALLLAPQLETVRENLGLDGDEPVTLAQLGGKVAAYWTKHGHSPAAPADVPTGEEPAA